MCFRVEHVTRLIPLAPILNPNNTEIIGIRSELCPAVQDIALSPRTAACSVVLVVQKTIKNNLIWSRKIVLEEKY